MAALSSSAGLGTTSGFPRDGCIVTAEPFVVLVRSHVKRWRAEHPGVERERAENGYFDGVGQDAPVQALVWLSVTASHIADPEGRWVPKLVVSRGLLENLVNGKHEVIELRVAEAIAIALDAPYETAGIEVMPNPLASEESRHEGWHSVEPSATCDICKREARAARAALPIAV